MLFRSLNTPVLFTAGSLKIAAGRVIRVQENNAVVAVLETYGQDYPTPDSDYELLYGEPFPEAANLPDFVVDRDEERENPQNEKFWLKGEAPSTPDHELDDDNYTPEILIKPLVPLPRTYRPHNFTFGLNLFRSPGLPSSSDVNPKTGAVNPPESASYDGYSLRYAYTFRTY